MTWKNKLVLNNINKKLNKSLIITIRFLNFKFKQNNKRLADLLINIQLNLFCHMSLYTESRIYRENDIRHAEDVEYVVTADTFRYRGNSKRL